MSDSLKVEPIAGALGAEIGGVDLGAEVDDATIAAIRRVWLQYGVVFFRDQDLSEARFLAFARRFGEVIEYPFVKGLEGFPEIIPVVKLEHERVNFGGVWHSDTSYLDIPPMGTMLIAREVPPYGGDTLFANMYLAYEALSDGMQRLLDGLVALNSSAKARCGAHARGPGARARARQRQARLCRRASGGAHASGDRPQGALRQYRAHARASRT